MSIIDDSYVYHQHKLNLSGQTRSRGLKKNKEEIVNKVAKDAENLIDNIAKTINQKFSEFLPGQSHSDNVLQCFQIFDPINWPVDENALGNYGHKELEKLLDHFQVILEEKGFECDAAICQTELLEILLYSQKLCKVDNSLIKSQHTLWGHVIKSKYDPCGESPFPGSAVLALVIIMLVISVASAEPERGFSHMGNIKTDCRSNLNTDHLNDLMTIKLSDATIDSTDLLVKAIDKWYNDSKYTRRFVEPHGTHVMKTPAVPCDE